MNYELRIFGVLLVVFGTGLAMGFVNHDLNFASTSRLANLAQADAYYYYDEYGNQMPAYEAPVDIVFPEDQYLRPPQDPSQWYLPEETTITVTDRGNSSWLFSGPEDLVGTPINEWNGYSYYPDAGSGYYAYDDIPYSGGYADYYDIYDYYDYYDYAPQRAVDPWYVSSFPGIGKLVQQMIPGQIVYPNVVAQPIVQPITQPSPRYPQASCWISAQPTAVNAGGSSVLTWSSFNATQAALGGVGSVPTSGTRTVSGLTSGQTFSLTVAGPGGNGSCYTRVEVRSPLSGPPSCIISVHPDSISAGQSASLAWGSQNASTALLSGIGQAAVQGGLTVSPAQTTTYVLTVSNPSNQSSQCSTLLRVR